jgi:hypothetical protein
VLAVKPSPKLAALHKKRVSLSVDLLSQNLKPALKRQEKFDNTLARLLALIKFVVIFS